ncbi:MAG: hypothetical protein ABS62_00310 [Microbacterium sp. SCN 70-200]|uniref:GntR family transcriptional regulator n=1 Tax=unclassified Microbacterium TaxID=2609290 RepID=UPI00086889DA|nr:MULTISPECIES: GntR family transcriptional regulator [unclassified Microbacterium]MBN9215037.1 GntR family transcriptional regulator [Microbacterium sp.]ODT42876.1 MAG: hypothetical protein ABS62_00310 [Microbacterium sp. SCN 70-200]OJV84817.1 MAG: hypothetical protein BGO46_05440 [Microbacterium sp. 70-16]
MTALTPRRMTDDVVRILRDRIVSGDLAPGARIDVTLLATDLGISRTPVREAILQLEAAGLVQRQPYRGTVVAGIDVNRLEEVTALRIDLEGRATTLGVPRLTDDDLDQMAAILDELDARAAEPDFSRGVFNDLNRRFHDIIYAAADAPHLRAIVGTLAAEADRMRLHFDVRAPLAEHFHREILDACRRRDASAAAAATRAHLLESYLAMRGGVGGGSGAGGAGAGTAAAGAGADRAGAVPPGILADVLADFGVEVTR